MTMLAEALCAIDSLREVIHIMIILLFARSVNYLEVAHALLMLPCASSISPITRTLNPGNAIVELEMVSRE